MPRGRIYHAKRARSLDGAERACGFKPEAICEAAGGGFLCFEIGEDFDDALAGGGEQREDH